MLCARLAVGEWSCRRREPNSLGPSRLEGRQTGRKHGAVRLFHFRDGIFDGVGDDLGQGSVLSPVHGVPQAFQQ